MWQQRAAGSAPATGSVAMAYDSRRGRTVLVDGAGETWEWDGLSWHHRAGAALPAARHGYGLAYDALRDRTVLVAGYAPGGLPIDEVWEWDGASWSRSRAATPGPRADPALAFDAVRGHLLLFGGNLGPLYLRETWRLGTDRVAAFEFLGPGCAGSAGVPALRPAADPLPWVGGAFPVELTNVASGAVCVLGFALDDTAWGAGPLPASLAPWMPGCTLHIDVVRLSAPRLGPNARWDHHLPEDPLLVGLRLHCQALVLDAAVPNALRAAVSDAVTATFGVR